MAVIHKLNFDFFNPELSCANHALQIIEGHWTGIDWQWIPGTYLPMIAIVVEASIGVLLLRGSLLVWPLGFLFHLPLTVTLAPAFGAVMFATYASSMSSSQWRMMRRTWRRNRITILLSLVGFIGVQAGLQQGLSLGLPWLQSLVGWTISVVAISTFLSRRAMERITIKQVQGPAWVLGIVWFVHGLTPYVGLQYQHTAAMLSNLRIDHPCRNSIVMPDVLNGVDPYIRIDVAKIGQGQRKRRESILTAQLWSMPALSAMHRHWCVPHLRPIYLQGTFEGIAFTIQDLCEPDWSKNLPSYKWPLGFQRFQKSATQV